MGQLLGIVTGTLSLVFLAWKAFDIGLGPTAVLVLDYYERLVGVLLGWTEPFFKGFFHELSKYIGLRIDLQEHWRHVFVLMALYVSACTRSTWAAFPGPKMIAVVVGVVGFTISIIASLASGAVEIISGYSSILLAAFPIAGIVIFELVLTAIDRGYFKSEGFRIGMVGIASAIVAILLKSQFFGEELKSVGLATLGVFTLLLAVYWVVYGAIEARNSGKEWRAYFLNCAPFKLGFIMLSSITGAAGFLLANAGLEAFGL